MVHVQDLTEREPIITFRGRKVWLMSSFKVKLSCIAIDLLSFFTCHYIHACFKASVHPRWPAGSKFTSAALNVPKNSQHLISTITCYESHWGLLSLPISLKCYSPFEGILDLHNISSFTQTPIILTMIFIDLYCANINPGKEIFICA